MEKLLRLPYGMLLIKLNDRGEPSCVVNQSTRRNLSISKNRGVEVSASMFTGDYSEKRSIAFGNKELETLCKGLPIHKNVMGNPYTFMLEEVVKDQKCGILLAGRSYIVTHTAGRPSKLMNVDGKIYKPYKRDGRETFELPYGDKKRNDYLYIRHISSFNISQVICGMITWTTIEGFTYINHKVPSMDFLLK